MRDAILLLPVVSYIRNESIIEYKCKNVHNTNEFKIEYDLK